MGKLSQSGTGVNVNIENAARYMLLSIFALSTIYPFFWTLLSSFKSSGEVYGNPFGLPREWIFSNYIKSYVGGNLGISFLNSFMYSTIATTIVLLLASMTAYILARVYTRFIYYLYFTLGIMIPVHTIIIPIFIMIRKMGLHNTRTGIILLYVVMNLSFSIFILVSFMKTIPKEIEESARMDGASLGRIFFSIILPIARPGLATVGTFTFLFCWNDFLVALIMASSRNIQTINLAVYNLRGMYVKDMGLISAGISWLIFPVMIVYIIFQEQVIRGLTAGAIKG
jgi:raffinose/stachyose/melibiose transport system permease protein